jgi:small subunit ribosomal protein S14
MAKKSQIACEKKRPALVGKYRARRDDLRRRGDWAALSELPPNSNPVLTAPAAANRPTVAR